MYHPHSEFLLDLNSEAVVIRCDVRHVTANAIVDSSGVTCQK